MSGPASSFFAAALLSGARRGCLSVKRNKKIGLYKRGRPHHRPRQGGSLPAHVSLKVMQRSECGIRNMRSTENVCSSVLHTSGVVYCQGGVVKINEEPNLP